MSDNTTNNPTGPEDGGDGVDFDALEEEVLENMDFKKIEASSGWSAIAISFREMPGARTGESLGGLLSGGPVTFGMIQGGLELLELAIIDSTAKEGGAALKDLSFGEWMELLEQWVNG